MIKSQEHHDEQMEAYRRDFRELWETVLRSKAIRAGAKTPRMARLYSPPCTERLRTATTLNLFMKDDDIAREAVRIIDSITRWPDTSCQCSISECICPLCERALRAWSNGSLKIGMTPDQREFCLSEIDSVEGYRREDYESYSESDLARGVLDAWRDYCRDKGML